MPKAELRRLFSEYDPAVETVISRVLLLEQEKISMDRPRVKEDIDRIIDKVARQELDHGTPGDDGS